MRTKGVAIFRCLLVPATVGALSLLSGCNNTGRDLKQAFEPWFPPTPGEVARDAFNVYDADRRQRSVSMLSAAKFGGEESYVRMYRLLINDPDATVRAACVKALGEHGTVDDAKLLIVRLGDDASFVRWEAAKSLQKIHNPEAVAPLINTLTKDEDADARMAAAYALGQYGEFRVFTALVGALDDQEFGVVRLATQSLETLTGQNFGGDGACWLAWSNANEGKLFDRQQTYVWMPYEKPRGVMDKAQFWKQHEKATPQPARGADADADAAS